MQMTGQLYESSAGLPTMAVGIFHCVIALPMYSTRIRPVPLHDCAATETREFYSFIYHFITECIIGIRRKVQFKALTLYSEGSVIDTCKVCWELFFNK